MIQIIVKNEELDIKVDQLVTFKKSQQLNGIQGKYSFSNTFSLDNSAKNRRLLGINYLPNSKAKSMTIGYDCDIILNGCIFLRKQKLKVQKEDEKSIPVYIIFNDSAFTVKSKELLLNQINLNANYDRSYSQFVSKNTPDNINARTAAISAQDKSGLLVVEEMPILLNLRHVVKSILTQLDYNYSGDFFTDLDIPKYYISQDVGQYLIDTNSVPKFDNSITCYTFLNQVLKTFNCYLEPSDSSKDVVINLWKNIDSIKSNFVDYSDKFIDFKTYTFEGGLAKKNIIEYSGSADYYNGFFENNKSIVDKTTYLKSDFGAGNTNLFEDQQILHSNTIELRDNLLEKEPKTINLYRFEEDLSNFSVYYKGINYLLSMYKAFSPNIFEIYTLFHASYCKNISTPTVAMLEFRYDAIFLSDFRMQEVFFTRQLSTYWLPLEINYSTKKDFVTIKSLMIEKTRADVPIVYDQSISIGFYEEIIINDIFDLYASTNPSPHSTFIVHNFDMSKNQIFITGSDLIEVEVLSVPSNHDIDSFFSMRIVNKDPINQIDNSDLLYQCISLEGGISRIAKINVAHNGHAVYISEFESATDVINTFAILGGEDEYAYLNYCNKITTAINIPTTLNPGIGGILGLVNFGTALIDFQCLVFNRDSFVKSKLTIGEATYLCALRENSEVIRRLSVAYNIYKNGVFFHQYHYINMVPGVLYGNVVTELNTIKTFNFQVLAGDIITIIAQLEVGCNINDFRNGSSNIKNINYTFEVEEQL